MNYQKTIISFLKKTTIIFLTVFFTLSFTDTAYSQTGLTAINKAYANWKTNLKIRSIDLDELMGGGPPKDGIPALFSPKFVSVNNADSWLNNVSPVISLTIKGKTKAYPLEILIWHEIVNDELSEVPIIVTFCPLCYSTLVYERKVDGKTTTFGTTGMLRSSNLVMYDNLTESFWQEFTGEAIVGEKTGTKLKLIPSQIISFEQFKKAFPDGEVLSRDTGYRRNYGKNPYIGYDDINAKPFLYRGKDDGRLPPNEKVIAVKIDGKYKAYPYSITKKKHVINDVVNKTPIVVFHIKGAASALDKKDINSSKDIGSSGVFNRTVNNKKLIFIYKDSKIMDNQTKSVWNITGKAIEGELKGAQLKIITFGDYFSFSWFAFRPDSELFGY